MSKRPIESWDKNNSSEVMDYILELITPMINLLDEKKVSHQDLIDIKQAMNLFTKHKDDCKQEELMQAINVCSSKVEKLTTAILTLTEKLDAEDVADLDKNYTETIQTDLN